MNDDTIKERNRQIKALRRYKYVELADPLFFKAQRGEIDMQVWLDAIQHIKDSNPLIEEDIT